MEKRRKRQVLDGTGSRSLNSTCRRLSCIGRLSVNLRQQRHSAALWATNQPSLGTACLTPTWLASRGQRASLPSGKKNKRKKKTANLKVARSNVRTMRDSEDRPQRRSALVARELARLDIDIAALSEVRFAEQGSLREDGAGYTLF